MDAIKLLKNDHRQVKKLFQEFENADGQQKATIAEQVFQELQVHTKIEEEIFYPAMKANGDSDDRDLVEESLDEHRAVAELIDELRSMDVGDDEYQDKFQELMENVEHHVEEEENEMFPDAEEVLSDSLERLGTQLQQRKQQLAAAVA